MTLFRILLHPLHGGHIIPHSCHGGVVPEVHVARLPVAVLGHNGYPQTVGGESALLVGMQPRQRRTIQEQHHVGILLDAPALAQVGQHGPLVGPVLRLPVQLAEQNHRNVQLPCQHLGLVSRLRHLLLAVAVLLMLHLALLVSSPAHVDLPDAGDQVVVFSEVIELLTPRLGSL